MNEWSQKYKWDESWQYLTKLKKWLEKFSINMENDFIDRTQMIYFYSV